MTTTLRFAHLATLALAGLALAGCQRPATTSANTSADAVSGTTSPNLSLLGIRIGMTADEVNQVLPGAHCVPAGDQPSCNIDEHAFGMHGIHVAFVDGKVDLARARGVADVARDIGPLGVTDSGSSSPATARGVQGMRAVLARQLGKPAYYQSQWSLRNGYRWRDVQATELALEEAPQNASDDLSYELSLTSPARRTLEETEHARQNQEVAKRVSQELGAVLAFDQRQRPVLCGLRVGDVVPQRVDCGAQIDLTTNGLGCELRWVRDRGCATITSDPGSMRLHRLKVRVPVTDARVTTMVSAVRSMPNAKDLHQDTDAQFRLPGTGLGDDVIWYSNADNDSLELRGLGIAVYRADPQKGLVTITISRRQVSSARFD